MKDGFKSVYAGQLSLFIEMKRTLGYSYGTEERIFSIFDRFAMEKGALTPGIEEWLAREWQRPRPNESERYRYDRVRNLAAFSTFLVEQGIRSYVPGLLPMPPNGFLPYIYSHAEMAALFRAADGLRTRMIRQDTVLFSFPVLLRLMYGTGIRKGEALAVMDRDVELESGVLLVRDSKNGKERTLPMSASLVSVLKGYLAQRERLPLAHPPERLLVRADGRACGGSSTGRWFRMCLHIAGIPYMGRKKGPRMHDIRHTFAVRAMVGMVEEGMDLYVALPVLSTYLGHGSIAATEHYVRLTMDMYPGLTGTVGGQLSGVFQKESHHGRDH